MPILRHEDLPGSGDFSLHRLRAWESPIRLAIPVASVLDIAFKRVNDAVEPGGLRGFVLLDDPMGLLPGAAREQLDHPDQPIVSHLSPRLRHGSLHAAVRFTAHRDVPESCPLTGRRVRSPPAVYQTESPPRTYRACNEQLAHDYVSARVVS